MQAGELAFSVGQTRGHGVLLEYRCKKTTHKQKSVPPLNQQKMSWRHRRTSLAMLSVLLQAHLCESQTVGCLQPSGHASVTCLAALKLD